PIDLKIKKIFRLIHEFLKSARAGSPNQGVGVLAFRKLPHPDKESGREQNLEGTLRSFFSGCIGVKKKNHSLGKTPEQRSLTLGESSSLGRDYILKSSLKGGNQVQLPFQDDCASSASDRALRLVHSEKNVSFGKKESLR